LQAVAAVSRVQLERSAGQEKGKVQEVAPELCEKVGKSKNIRYAGEFGVLGELGTCVLSRMRDSGLG
jgi:hypothetical protein